MPVDVNTCPACGALITAQLARCRRCGHYLHGTKIEGLFFEHLLPESLRLSPGTGALSLILVLYFVLMVVLAGPISAFDFTRYSLTQLGANAGQGIFDGEYWRFLTSVLGHGDAFHLAFNLYALSIAGPLVEQAYDRKKMIFIFFLSGVLAAATSFVFGALVRDNVFHLSIGASGGVSGLMGASWIGARRMGSAGKEVAQRMGMWILYMLGFGFIWPAVDNAAHIGGLLVGIGLAALAPLGVTQTVAAQRVLSVALLGVGAVTLLSVYLMLAQLRGYPVALPDDMEPQTVVGMVLKAGADPDYSSQKFAVDECTLKHQNSDPGVLGACELALRAVPYHLPLYPLVAELNRQQGNLARAEKLERLFRRMTRQR